MAALHDALKTLGPANFSDTPLEDLKPFLSTAFTSGQLIVDSVPIPAPASEPASPEARSRANTTTSIASSASEISISSHRATPPPPDVEALQNEWKPVKLNPKENPLGMNVYKLGAKDGRGSWFARRSVHEGLGFTKWKKGLEREFPETMKVQGGPGEGNIRGIGGERRVEYKNVDGVGKMEVYLLSAQFPGPTTPRDFVTMFLTSDQALSDQSGGENEVPRHFMVISKPCQHPDTPPREGYIRGSYESVEFIREIPIKPSPKKSASATNLTNHTRNRSSTLGKEAMLRNARKHSPPGIENGSTTSEKDAAPDSDFSQADGVRARGKTFSEGMTVAQDNLEEESNPVEWIMITRSDPGGSVPRFMVERGTPGGIVSDASKFLNWACAKDIEDFEDNEESLSGGQDEKAEKHEHRQNHDNDLHNFQTNGHLAGLEEGAAPASENPQENISSETAQENGTSGYLGMVTGAAAAAGALIASHTPQIISSHIPGHTPETSTARRDSTSTISSSSSAGSFASALENRATRDSALGNDTSLRIIDSQAQQRPETPQEKELQKLEEKKRRLDDKLRQTRDKEMNKKSDDSAKEQEAMRKAEEKHEREVKKQEEKYKREVEKLEQKKAKEDRKADERRRKAADRDEKTRMLRELEELRAEVEVVRKEKSIMLEQIGALQAENTALAAKVGRMGLMEVKDDVSKTGRARASSLKGITRAMSSRTSGSSGSQETNKEGLGLATAVPSVGSNGS